MGRDDLSRSGAGFDARLTKGDGLGVSAIKLRGRAHGRGRRNARADGRNPSSRRTSVADGTTASFSLVALTCVAPRRRRYADGGGMPAPSELASRLSGGVAAWRARRKARTSSGA